MNIPYSRRFAEAVHNLEGLTDLYILKRTQRTLIEKPFEINLQRLVTDVVEKMRMRKLALTSVQGSGEAQREVVSSLVRGTMYVVLLNEWCRYYESREKGEVA